MGLHRACAPIVLLIRFILIFVIYLIETCQRLFEETLTKAMVGQPVAIHAPF